MEIERILTPEAQADRDEFDLYDITYGGCSCHINPPCGYCTHPGNPANQDEEDSCWMDDDESKEGA
jgi:hypothetical protein